MKALNKLFLVTLNTIIIAACGEKGEEATKTINDQTSTSTDETGDINDTKATNVTEGESASTTGDGGTDTECNFICETDTDDAGPDLQCDVWEQDCPEGQKCMPWANDGGTSWNATKCTDINPNPGLPGDPCTVTDNGVSGIDSCEEGAMCWNVDPETNEGVCVGFCDGSPDNFSCTEQNTTCVIANQGVLILCVPTCDPLLQNCEGELCIPNPTDADYFVCILDASGEEGAYGDPCEFANACDPGLVCLDAPYVPGCQASGCCTPFCNLMEEYTCPGQGQECIAWHEEMVPPGYENVGVCGIPQ